MSEQPEQEAPDREDAEAGSYLELQGEVDRSFGGSWEAFLKAVSNPAEILYFVLWRHCKGKAHKLEAWAKDKKIPDDWLPRFYGMLTPKGEFRDGVSTRAPKEPAGAPPEAAEAATQTSDDAAQTSEAAAQTAPKTSDGEGSD